MNLGSFPLRNSCHFSLCMTAALESQRWNTTCVITCCSRLASLSEEETHLWAKFSTKHRKKDTQWRSFKQVQDCFFHNPKLSLGYITNGSNAKDWNITNKQSLAILSHGQSKPPKLDPTTHPTNALLLSNISLSHFFQEAFPDWALQPTFPFLVVYTTR